MEKQTKYLFGTLLIILVSVSLTSIYFGENARIDVGKDKTSFFVNEDSSWVISGVEYNKLYNGSKLLSKISSKTAVQTEIDNSSNLVTITRTTPYSSGGLVVDTYIFDGKIDNIKLFPISHQVEIYNVTGCGSNQCIYQYEVRNLLYDGVSRVAYSPESFGRNMVVEWQDGYYSAKVFQQKRFDKLIIRYRINNSYESFYVRLFDPVPVVSNVVLNATDNPTNSSGANLTLYWDASDADGDSITNITDWRINGSSIAVLNMPFENNTATPSSNQVDYSIFSNNASGGSGGRFNS
ncbi:MAG: hypothetical protein Q8O68_00450, partial [Candidatus Daviesbacteria bacterium]|nr:hypothetical protein [Candidatus Daviesbacteria bacterium]